MDKKPLLVGVAGGLIAGLILGIGWLGGVAAPRVAAQAPAVDPPRFQIATWAYPATAYETNGGMSPGSHGAFVFEPRTGRLWQSKDGGQLQPLGQPQ